MLQFILGAIGVVALSEISKKGKMPKMAHGGEMRESIDIYFLGDNKKIDLLIEFEDKIQDQNALKDFLKSKVLSFDIDGKKYYSLGYEDIALGTSFSLNEAKEIAKELKMIYPKYKFIIKEIVAFPQIALNKLESKAFVVMSDKKFSEEELYLIQPFVKYAKGGGVGIDYNKFLKAKTDQYRKEGYGLIDAIDTAFRDLGLETEGKFEKREFDKVVASNPNVKKAWTNYKKESSIYVKDGYYVNPYQMEYAKGGGVRNSILLYEGQSLILNSVPSSKEEKFLNTEIVVEKIKDNKIVEAFVRETGEKVPFVIDPYKFKMQQYAKGGGVGKLKTKNGVEYTYFEDINPISKKSSFFYRIKGATFGGMKFTYVSDVKLSDDEIEKVAKQG